MRWVLLGCAAAIGLVGYAIHTSHQAQERSRLEAAGAMERWRETVTRLESAPAAPTAEDLARAECEARARMAAAVHRADPAQVREACLFTWRTTGALPR